MSQNNPLEIRGVFILEQCASNRKRLEDLLKRKRYAKFQTDIEIAEKHNVFIGTAEFEVVKTRIMQDLASDGVEDVLAAVDLINEMVDFVRDLDGATKRKEAPHNE